MKKLLVLMAMMAVVLFANAQVTDFSGKWKLNPAKSQLSAEYSMAPKEVIIVQSGNNLEVERHSTFQEREFTIKDKFTLDGKECLNKGWMETEKKSVATPSDDKKSVKIATTIPMGNNGNMTLTETYKLDGKTLIIVAVGSSSFGERTETMAFDPQ